MGEKQLECRIVITHRGRTFDIGMYDPVSGRYEPLGAHHARDQDWVVRDLKARIEREGHLLTFSEIHGAR